MTACPWPERLRYKAVIARTGDTLSSIAARELGHVRHWRELAAANRLTDSALVLPGDLIVIPEGRPLPMPIRRHAF